MELYIHKDIKKVVRYETTHHDASFFKDEREETKKIVEHKANIKLNGKEIEITAPLGFVFSQIIKTLEIEKQDIRNHTFDFINVCGMLVLGYNLDASGFLKSRIRAVITMKKDGFLIESPKEYHLKQMGRKPTIKGRDALDALKNMITFQCDGVMIYDNSEDLLCLIKALF